MTIEYRIAIRTGTRFGSGTDAEVSVILVGDQGESERHALGRRFHNDFEAGAEDVFVIEAPDVGDLILLRFTNAGGLAGDWLLDSVRVTAGERTWDFPYFRWIPGGATAEVLEGTARLPQHARSEREAAARRELLHARRELYPWRPAEATAGLPGALDITEERPLPQDERYRTVGLNSMEAIFAKTMAALKLHAPVLTKAWNAIVDTFHLFKGLELPEIARRWEDDYEFARQATQGISPYHIELATALPPGFSLADADVRGLLSPGMTLAQTLAARRLFLLDFEILGDIPMFQKGDDRRWAPPARCLLFLDDTRQLRPLAIQLGRDPERDPVFTPNDSEHDWLAAKIYVRCSEGNIHQMVEHALRTHFVVEPFLMATMRNLPDPHPVYKLLRRHFRYTFAINEMARTGLLAEGGVFDDFIATGGPAKGHVQLGRKGYARWTLRDNQPRSDLARRGVLDPAVLPSYPYRDDALLLWNAIEEYVYAVLGHFYRSDADLAADAEMAAWWADLTSRGLPVEKLPCTELARVADLVEILATVVFTASVRHASVNYLQYEHYGYVPNAPLCMRRPPPAKKGTIGPEDFAEMLPTKSQTLWQIAMGRALASFGEDEEFLLHEGGWREDYFREPELIAIRDRFHERLRAQLAAVKARNAGTDFPYTVLQADRVPCGITI
jgi:arachidonate 5-lipoxygenase